MKRSSSCWIPRARLIASRASRLCSHASTDSRTKHTDGQGNDLSDSIGHEEGGRGTR